MVCHSVVLNCSLLHEFQLTAEEKQQFYETLSQLPDPINEAIQIATELAKKSGKGESSTDKVTLYMLTCLMYY